MKTYKIPFRKHKDQGEGSTLLEFSALEEDEIDTDKTWGGHPDEWRDNTQFGAAVRLVTQGRGRSSVRVYVEVVSSADRKRLGDRYSMGISAFFEAVCLFGVTDKTIYGTWEFRKQGQNYTLWPVGVEE